MNGIDADSLVNLLKCGALVLIVDHFRDADKQACCETWAYKTHIDQEGFMAIMQPSGQEFRPRFSKEEIALYEDTDAVSMFGTKKVLQEVLAAFADSPRKIPEPELQIILRGFRAHIECQSQSRHLLSQIPQFYSPSPHVSTWGVLAIQKFS